MLDEPPRWNKEIINHLFAARDAELIYQIPLCGGHRPDRLLWHYTPSGEFSVKSAYNLGVQFMGRCGAEHTASSSKNSLG